MGRLSLRTAMALALALCGGLAVCGEAFAIGEPEPLYVATGPGGYVYTSVAGPGAQVTKYTANGDFVTRWGSFGSKPGRLYEPRGIATDLAGNVFVADTFNHRIDEFAPGGRPIGRLRHMIEGTGYFSNPLDVATDALGNVFATVGSRIERYGPDGSFLTTWGSDGPQEAQLSEARGVATDALGNVFVADTYSDQIKKYTADGAFVAGWGSRGNAPGQFTIPYGVATDALGNVYVADTGNGRIQKFTGSGDFIGTWGSYGRRPGHFYTPTSLAVDSAGNVYVADAGNGRIQKFTANGEYLAEWGYRAQPPRPARARLISGPQGRTAKRTAVFRFRSRQRGVGFECILGGEGVPKRLSHRWRGCASPWRYRHLRPGRKVFRVRTVKYEERSRPAVRSWRVVERRRSG